jgi:hypothetical protein
MHVDGRLTSGGTKVAIGLAFVALVVVALVLLSAYAGGLGASFMDDNPQPEVASAPGMGRAGTLTDPAGLWSGPVVCEWTDNPVMTTGVEYIRAYAVPITRAALVPGGDPFSGTVTYLDLGRAQGWAALSEARRQNFDVNLAIATGGRTGTATTIGGAIIFEWNCSAGPDSTP